jgi:predicted PurR-regulated permease PerM
MLEVSPVNDPDSTSDEHTPVSGPVERVAQTGLIVLLVVWCFHVVRPFIVPVAWGAIIAVSLYPLQQRLEATLSGRRVLAATLTTLLSLAVLVVPIAYLGDTLVATVEHISQGLDKEEIHIPPPPEAVARLPLVGPTIDKYWRKATQDKGALRAALERHLKPLGTWFVSAAAGVSFAMVQFVVAIFIAGVMLASTTFLLTQARRIILRLAPRKGRMLVTLAESTIRNVSRGVLGVAFIQALCAGIGFLLAAVPAAGLWALLCFILAVVQIGVLPIVAPAALYVLFTADMTTAIPFAIWCAFVGLIDNFLKPLLLHHGMSTPLWIIVVGSIGGLLSSGVIGLFIGPVVLVLGYELFQAWISEDGRDQVPSST